MKQHFYNGIRLCVKEFEEAQDRIGEEGGGDVKLRRICFVQNERGPKFSGGKLVNVGITEE
jgi:hypothetical protein